jgi:hypothetical protein
MKKDKQDRIKKAIIEMLEQGHFISYTCEKIGIARDTFYRWLVKDKKFKEEVERAQLSRIKIVEDALYKKAVEGNPTCIIFFLVNQAPHKWKNIQRVDTTLETKDIQIEIVKVVSDDKTNTDKKQA